MRRRLPSRLGIYLLLGLLSSVFMIGFAPAFADYQDGFDTYPTGTTFASSTAYNGQPWIYTPDTAADWVPGITDTTTGGIVTAYTTPNFYSLALAAAGENSAHHALLEEGMNATKTTVTFSFYLNVAVAPSANNTAGVAPEICGALPSTTAQILINGTNPGTGTYSRYVTATLGVGGTPAVNVYQVYQENSGGAHWGPSAGGHSTWVKITWTAFVTISATCTGGVGIQTNVTAGNSAAASVGFDNTFLYGANTYMQQPSALSNLYLISYPPPTQTWFNISDYQSSYVRINYYSHEDCSRMPLFTQASPDVCVSSALGIPALKVDLNRSSLISVYVGDKIGCTTNCLPYTETIIPQANLLNNATSTTARVYLSAPNTNSLFTYQLSINDFTSQFPAAVYNSTGAINQGTQLFVSQGTEVITSGLIDAQSAFGMTMSPGIYSFTLEGCTSRIYGNSSDTEAGNNHCKSLNVYTTTLTLTSSNLTPSILIQNASSPVSIGPFQQYTAGQAWDCDTGGITARITDSLGTATSEVFNLYSFNSTYPGGVIIGTDTKSVAMTAGSSVSYDFRNSTLGTDNLSFYTPENYEVGYVLNGVSLNGVYPATSSPNCSHTPSISGSAGGFQLPMSVLGLDQIFRISNGWEALMACFAVIATVGIMAARMAHIAGLVMGCEIGLFGVMQWLPSAALILCPIFLCIGAITTLTNRARRPID